MSQRLCKPVFLQGQYVAGKVKEVKVKAGDKLKPGQIVLVMENGATGATSANVPAPAPAPEAPAASAACA